jgi:hypothetical protein
MMRTNRDLATHSYAVVEVPISLGQKLDALQEVAEDFFRAIEQSSESSSELFEKFRVLQQTPHGGLKLLGYSRPSPQKHLFRYYRNSGDSTKWPSLEMRAAVESCERELHQFLTAQFDQVISFIFPQKGKDQTVSYESLWRVNQHPVKPVADSDYGDCCPLDIFYYPNAVNTPRASEPDEAAEPDDSTRSNKEDIHISDVLDDRNCGAHLDRGLMHIIFSTIPGLQVLDHQTKEWVDVMMTTTNNRTTIATPAAKTSSCDTDSSNCTKRIKRLKVESKSMYQNNVETVDNKSVEKYATKHAVILINSLLQQLTENEEEEEENGSTSTPHDEMRACVHRVVAGKEPRLSISFELRVPDESKEAIARMRHHCFVSSVESVTQESI